MVIRFTEKKLTMKLEEDDLIEVWVRSGSWSRDSVHLTEWFIQLNKPISLLPDYLHLVFETSSYDPPGQLRVDLSTVSMYLITAQYPEVDCVGMPRSKVLEQAEKYYLYYHNMAEEAKRHIDCIRRVEACE